jgi:uncharacterized protein (DUF4213/DUF364 family)
MKVLQELVESLRIDLPVTAGVVGSHLIAVASRRLGLAAHLHGKGQTEVVVSEEGVKTLIGRSACDLASWLLEDHWVRAGIGMAALNSVLEIDHQALIEVNAKQIIADRAIGKNLMVVGHFPFIGQLRSQVLINHTFDRIMANCKPGSFKVMLGPSTPLSTILLEYGLDVIGGALVAEKSTVLRMVKDGVPFRQMEGIRTVVMTKDIL